MEKSEVEKLEDILERLNNLDERYSWSYEKFLLGNNLLVSILFNMFRGYVESNLVLEVIKIIERKIKNPKLRIILIKIMKHRGLFILFYNLIIKIPQFFKSDKFLKQAINEKEDEVGKSLLKVVGYPHNFEDKFSDITIKTDEKTGINVLSAEFGNMPRLRYDTEDIPETFEEFRAKVFKDNEKIIAELSKIKSYNFHSKKSGEFLYLSSNFDKEQKEDNKIIINCIRNYLSSFTDKEIKNAFSLYGSDLTKKILTKESALSKRKLPMKKINYDNKSMWIISDYFFKESGNLRGSLNPSAVFLIKILTLNDKHELSESREFLLKILPAYSDEHFANSADFMIQDILHQYNFYGGGKILIQDKYYTFLVMDFLKKTDKPISVKNYTKIATNALITHSILAESDWLHGDAHTGNIMNIISTNNIDTDINTDNKKTTSCVLIDYGNSFRISTLKTDNNSDIENAIIFMNIFDPCLSVYKKILDNYLQEYYIFDFDIIASNDKISIELFEELFTKKISPLNRIKNSFTYFYKYYTRFFPISLAHDLFPLINVDLNSKVIFDKLTSDPEKYLEKKLYLIMDYVKIFSKKYKKHTEAEIKHMMDVTKLFYRSFCEIIQIWKERKFGELKKVYLKLAYDLLKNSNINADSGTGKKAGGYDIKSVILIVILIAAIIILLLYIYTYIRIPIKKMKLI